ncbi:facilitated trehalose transporter Tret1-like isoform X3 [Homarus americanus]|uniref:facilitated trehalose transporter Tret1-like isoform X3 n=1 Tax=Homarus americanus TaxID=6706 RepID=UPI001C45F9E1|nr:facilitated trehalose transporter Tret1-like isoform X3 [Homarus americanus]
MGGRCGTHRGGCKREGVVQDVALTWYSAREEHSWGQHVNFPQCECGRWVDIRSLGQPLVAFYTGKTSSSMGDLDSGSGEDEGGRVKSSSSHKITAGCYCGSNVGPFVRQLTMTVVSCLAALNLGLIYAYPAVALARWEEAGVNHTTTEITWFASTPMVVSVVVSVVSGVVMESLGVRCGLLLCLPFLTLSWIMIAITHEFWVLLLARVIQGFVASMFMVAITVYPVEVSAVRWRGIMVGVSEAMVMLGAFFTYLAGLVLFPSTLAYTFVGVTVPQVFCFYFMRESPLWLTRQDRDDDAAVSLACLRGPGVDITWELEQIKANVYSERIQKPSASEQLLLLRKPVYLKPILLCVLVLLFKELTGQFAAMAYAVKIFQMAGSTLNPYWCAVVMGAVRFLPCFASWALIERVPRRVLLCSCMTIASFSLATLGAFLWFWSWSDEGLPASLGWIPLTCLSVFTLSFGSGIGPTSWTLVAELIPSQVRNVGAGIINSSFSLFLFLVGLTFPFAVEYLGVGAVYIVYSVCSLVGVIFVVTCLPETKGSTFDEIQIALDNKWNSNVV